MEVMSMRAGFIGAGKVGFSLGRYLAEGGVTVTGYYSRNSRSAREAAEFTGTDHYEDLDAITADSDTLFITVPDGAISGVWDRLLLNWLINIPRNFIMALPFQLLVAGPLVRALFRRLFPVGCVH